MSNITNIDPVVTEAKLTEFYNDIKPFLGCPAYVTQEGDEMYFSTDEKVVGRWYDGKPLYQRTFTGTMANLTNQTLVELDQTVYTIVYWMTYNHRANTHEVYPLDAYIDNASSMSTFVAADGLRLYTTASSYLKDKPFYAVIWYTKVADSAVTTIEQKPTHYSTDEKVVGTWIDGKPVYQRTYTTTAPNASSNGSYAYKTIVHNITNVDKFVDVRGTLTSSDFSSVLPFFTDGGNKTKFNINATDISIANDCVYSNGRDLILTVRYTKTTD